MKRLLGWLFLTGILVFGLIQLVPYGRDHTNPPTRYEPTWDSPRTRELAVGACFDCHSNETVWPWYTNIAPMSWLIQRDVDEGRSELNFSEWQRRQPDADEMAEHIEDGHMPPLQYRMLHAGARLSEDEKDALIDGLMTTVGED
jgi:hypothetical protein